MRSTAQEWIHPASTAIDDDLQLLEMKADQVQVVLDRQGASESK
jgi:hypothetical protein